MMSFVECRECASKSGSPDLCPSCLENRRCITNQSANIKDFMNDIKVLRKQLKAECKFSRRLLQEIARLMKGKR